MVEAKSGDVVAFLDRLLEFFENGARWKQGDLTDIGGNRCLVGAIDYVRDAYNIDHLEPTIALYQALPDRSKPIRYNYLLGDYLAAFNDSRRTFGSIRRLILKARALALEKQEQRRAEMGEAAHRREAAEKAKRFLLAEIEQERAGRAAAGDTRPTWISCPRVPAPERLAA
jgi:hypothetical protein